MATTPPQKQLLLWTIKDLSNQYSHMEKHMFHIASAKETSLPPCKVLGKYSSNVCTHYEFFLIATASAIHFL